MEMIERNGPGVEEVLLMFHNHVSYECALLFIHFIFILRWMKHCVVLTDLLNKPQLAIQGSQKIGKGQFASVC